MRMIASLSSCSLGRTVLEGGFGSDPLSNYVWFNLEYRLSKARTAQRVGMKGRSANRWGA